MIGWVVRRFILKALRAWTSRTESRAGLVLAEALSGPILIWAAILALHVALQSSDLPGKFTDWGAKTLFVLWIASLTLMSMRIARDSIRFYGSRSEEHTSELQSLTNLGCRLLLQKKKQNNRPPPPTTSYPRREAAGRAIYLD